MTKRSIRRRPRRAQALQVTKPYTSYPGHSGYPRVLHDYYREPARAIDPFLEVETFTGNLIAPCMGGGTIVARCRAYGYQIEGSDLQNIAGCRVRDVFDLTERFDNAITNPPYKPADRIVLHLMPLARFKIAMLLRTCFLHGIKRYKTFFPRVPLARVWVLSRRPSCPPGIYQGERDNRGCLIQPEETGGKIDYAWFVFEHGHTGAITIDWLG